MFTWKPFSFLSSLEEVTVVEKKKKEDTTYK